jgi:hypothetical protein
MTNAITVHPRYQRATVSLRVGKRTQFSADVKITSGGLLSIAALVSTILLATAVLVDTAAKAEAKATDR